MRDPSLSMQCVLRGSLLVGYVLTPSGWSGHFHMFSALPPTTLHAKTLSEHVATFSRRHAMVLSPLCRLSGSACSAQLNVSSSFA